MLKASAGDSLKEKPLIPKGLTLLEIASRFEKGQVNYKNHPNLKSVWGIFSSNIFSYFNLILFVLAALLLSIKSFENMVFVIIMVLNTAIGIIQELKARKTIMNLTLLSQPTALVRRQGFEIEIATDQLVLDDIYLLQGGKQVVADSIIQNGELTVSEANLTGESDAIVKKVNDKILSGSFVISGTADALIVAVGKDNYIETLSDKIKTLGKPNSEILKSLKKLLKFIGVIIVPLGLMTFYTAFLKSEMDYLPDFLANSELYHDALKKMAGAMVAMVPSGLFLLTTITFASSVVKLAKHQTLVQELYSIETLSRVDLVCLDKTGTITDGTMKVDSYVWIEPEKDEPAVDLPVEEEIHIASVKPSIDIKTIIASMNYALKDNNQTAMALKNYFGSKRKLRSRVILPFESANKYSAVSFDEGTYAIGAPELVFKGKYMHIRKQVEKYARLGKRVLLFAKADAIGDKRITGSVEPIALILINDTIRETAKATLDEFQEAGVGIKVISGDNAITVSEVAARAGVPKANKYLSLEKIDDDKLREICEDYTVFGRVTPHQKQVLIETFKQNKHKVAMIGDGVNDVLALKAADCSVAIASGSEAARNISHLVLMNDDFASLPKVVKQGRQIVNNMQNASVLYLVKTMYTILLTMIVLMTANIYPFEPVQMFVIETFIIGIPSFFIALEPNESRFEGKFLWNVFKNVIPGTILVIANLIGVYVFASQWPSITQGEISTVGIIAATFAYLLVLVNVSQPLNKRRSFVVIAAAIVSAFCFVVLGERFFKLSTLTIPSILLLILLMQSTYLIMSIYKQKLIKFWV